MLSVRLLRVTVLLSAALIAASGPALGRSASGAQKATVHFLATGTLVRVSWGMNEDTYLSTLTFPKRAEPLMVRLIDEYSQAHSALSREMLTEPQGAILRVRRDASCDRPFAQMLLRTAPGDPLAPVPERLSYRLPSSITTPLPDATLPCYRVERR